MSEKKYAPEDYARSLLASMNLTRIQNLNEVLHQLRLSVVEKDLTSFEGLLVTRSNRSKGIIAINRKVREVGRKNFTICHEIGHFILPRHGVEGCKKEEIESWRNGIHPHELEANRFASELLLPKKEVFPLVTKKKATIALAKEISRDFQTSLTATSLKCVEITDEKCALVWSVNGQIKWFRRNENFTGFIRSGRIDSDSIASKINDSIREKDGFVSAENWLQSDYFSSSDEIWEDSVYLPSYNGVLTILTLD